MFKYKKNKIFNEKNLILKLNLKESKSFELKIIFLP